jgi:hypothetical protein
LFGGGVIEERRRQRRRTPRSFMLRRVLGRASTKPPALLRDAERGTLHGDLTDFV